MCLHVWAYVGMCVCVYICVCIRIFIYIHIQTYIIYIYTCLYTRCSYACVCMCTICRCTCFYVGHCISMDTGAELFGLPKMNGYAAKLAKTACCCRRGHAGVGSELTTGSHAAVTLALTRPRLVHGSDWADKSKPCQL